MNLAENPREKLQERLFELSIVIDKNQKMSVVNLLFLITISDPNRNKEKMPIMYELLESYRSELGISIKDCQTYLNKFGHERMFEDLKAFSKEQKQILVQMAWPLILLDDGNTEIKKKYMVISFFAIGLSRQDITSSIAEYQEGIEKYLKWNK